ncbi:NAD(P)-dependent alcohol dehydrogenase [Lentzea sp.]|uniref:NAD(P)-dependent alcohol dehydrogenase n=1 Tax=Lentzea sp. TaxID=56099 RepID=UPI002CFBFA2B|nr:NAD(P)-dependent alcohol dehydrogenase [Lentzea sp.]HUQ58073.1 NAD(P)-dependent alcohol dehydrogenase [Lentzea sp.]
MRRVEYDHFGGPEVLHVSEVPVPTAGPGQVLVEVLSAGVGGGETAIRAGKLRRVMRLRFPQGTGNEFAGRVAAVGAGVRYRVGDLVWGLMPHGTFGAIAEQVVVPQDRLAALPAGLDPATAGAMPVSGTTAITALEEKARLRPGERLLVRGATGGVGSIAVQLGRYLGAHVTAMAGQRNLEWVRELGADAALDYRTTRPGDLEPFDVIVDLVGTDLPAYRRRLTRGGRMVALAIAPDAVARSVAATVFGRVLRRPILSFSNNPSAHTIARLTELVEAGAVRPVLDRAFPMEEIADVHRLLEAGGVRGKYVIAP